MRASSSARVGSNDGAAASAIRGYEPPSAADSSASSPMASSSTRDSHGCVTHAAVEGCASDSKPVFCVPKPSVCLSPPSRASGHGSRQSRWISSGICAGRWCSRPSRRCGAHHLAQQTHTARSAPSASRDVVLPKPPCHMLCHAAVSLPLCTLCAVHSADKSTCALCVLQMGLAEETPDDEFESMLVRIIPWGQTRSSVVAAEAEKRAAWEAQSHSCCGTCLDCAPFPRPPYTRALSRPPTRSTMTSSPPWRRCAARWKPAVSRFSQRRGSPHLAVCSLSSCATQNLQRFKESTTSMVDAAMALSHSLEGARPAS
jgi:hypothetical protein